MGLLSHSRLYIQLHRSLGCLFGAALDSCLWAHMSRFISLCARSACRERKRINLSAAWHWKLSLSQQINVSDTHKTFPLSVLRRRESNNQEIRVRRIYIFIKIARAANKAAADALTLKPVAPLMKWQINWLPDRRDKSATMGRFCQPRLRAVREKHSAHFKVVHRCIFFSVSEGYFYTYQGHVAESFLILRTKIRRFKIMVKIWRSCKNRLQPKFIWN